LFITTHGHDKWVRTDGWPGGGTDTSSDSKSLSHISGSSSSSSGGIIGANDNDASGAGGAGGGAAADDADAAAAAAAETSDTLSIKDWWGIEVDDEENRNNKVGARKTGGMVKKIRLEGNGLEGWVHEIPSNKHNNINNSSNRYLPETLGMLDQLTHFYVSS
jgi:hypothetical protein